jgi:hypothetical protein
VSTPPLTLRHAGLVTATPQGREIMYRLSPAPPGLGQVRAYVERVSRLWDDALQAFKAFAEREDTR